MARNILCDTTLDSHQCFGYIQCVINGLIGSFLHEAHTAVLRATHFFPTFYFYPIKTVQEVHMLNKLVFNKSAPLTYCVRTTFYIFRMPVTTRDSQTCDRCRTYENAAQNRIITDTRHAPHSNAGH